MQISHRDQRFLRSTRGRILTLLRDRLQTVEELARSLGLTSNAIRAHLATLERDGLIEQRDIRRGPSKPSYVYGLTTEAELQFSRAYVPVLGLLLAELVETEDAERLAGVMRQVGQRLARQLSQSSPASQDVAARLKPAIEIIGRLGGAAIAEVEGQAFEVHDNCCPLAGITSRYQVACQAIAGLMSEVIGVPVAVQCELGEHPRCRLTGTFETHQPTG
ncbi:MAG TPA: helix-turn-helix domain-containing protein [Thermomicrobiaceae bacterium]|nr:helix-turn-helix domain-containing protein [Thermomicrobiaceae bacterium]